MKKNFRICYQQELGGGVFRQETVKLGRCLPCALTNPGLRSHTPHMLLWASLGVIPKKRALSSPEHPSVWTITKQTIKKAKENKKEGQGFTWQGGINSSWKWNDQFLK